MSEQTVFILKCDPDGTLRSRAVSFGVAVNTEAEAQRFVKEGGVGYTHSYEKIVIFSNKDNALDYDQNEFIQNIRNTQ